MAKIKKTTGEILFDVFNYVLMLILSFAFIYPFWETLVNSFSSPVGAQRLGLKFYPIGFNLDSYINIFKSKYIFIGYYNTLYRTIIGTVLSVLVTYCGAYVLSKKNLPGRVVILFLITFTMFFSGGLIPSYLNMRRLNLINTRWALILPGLTSAWNLIIARNFIDSLPDSLEEAAIVDGAHPLIIVFRIMLPISMPIIAVLALWNAVGHWNSWFDANIYVRDPKKVVLQLVLRRVLIDDSRDMIGGDVLKASTASTTPETIKAATIIVSIVPIILFYPYLQKYFVKGVMIGAIKG
ncbi:MAG: carbohydrate ABC transporter permease [Clostridiaceae bacterium]|nr:carbohydrate ABC transporter permease [Clostridiaceae bacterium]